MRRPTEYEMEQFLQGYGIDPRKTKVEWIEVTKDGEFQFYMTAFHSIQKIGQTYDIETSLAVFWPQTGETDYT